MKRIVNLIYLLSPLLWIACISPFDVEDSVSGTTLLVVDGKITDQTGAWQVELSYSSSSLKSYEGEKISGAQVTISSNADEEIYLTESEPGVYVPEDADRVGEPGKIYQLRITTPDGKRYASQPETMVPVPPIDSIYAKLESVNYLSALNDLLTQWGMRIYVSTGSKTSNPGFYRWEWAETYEVNTVTPESISTPSTCWIYGNIYRSIILGTTSNLEKDVISNQPILFVPKRGAKLGARYSVRVKQYSLTRSTYDYWNKINEQIESAGSIFDPAPAQIIGNICNVDDNDEIVLGNFQVSAYTEKRFFISRGEVPNNPGGPISPFPECAGEFPADFCFDCSRIFGATTERPPFW